MSQFFSFLPSVEVILDTKHSIHLQGATFCTQMTNMEGEDVFEPSYLGTADEVAQERICDDELILIKG